MTVRLQSSRFDWLDTAAWPAVATVRVAAALLEKASWPATARHVAGMANF
jgi:hypothetical protein